MSVQAAGARLVRGVAHLLQAGQHFGPGHLLAVVVQTHGMGDQLEAVLQTSIVLAIQGDGVAVRNTQHISGVVIILASTIYFKLHAEVTGAFAIEHRCGLEVVVPDCAATIDGMVAVVAKGIVVIFVLIIGILIADQTATIVADGVVMRVAGITQRSLAGAGIVLPPNALAAAGTDQGVLLQAVAAQILTTELSALSHGVDGASDFAGKGVIHNDSSQK